jgi:hypothetical protein
MLAQSRRPIASGYFLALAVDGPQSRHQFVVNELQERGRGAHVVRSYQTAEEMNQFNSSGNGYQEMEIRTGAADDCGILDR